VCLAKNFDRTEINNWISQLEPEAKVKGIQAYEWKEVKSRKEVVLHKIK
jgi:hypothetical protein